MIEVSWPVFVIASLVLIATPGHLILAASGTRSPLRLFGDCDLPDTLAFGRRA